MRPRRSRKLNEMVQVNIRIREQLRRELKDTANERLIGINRLIEKLLERGLQTLTKESQC